MLLTNEGLVVTTYRKGQVILELLIKLKQSVLNGEYVDHPDTPRVEELDAMIAAIHLQFPGIEPASLFCSA